MALIDNNNDKATCPVCSIIIPTRDKLNYLKPCIDSVRRHSGEHELEIIVVDNGSEEASTLAYLDSLKQQSNVQVLQWNKPFNFSAINNYAATMAHSELLCFLNNDIEINDSNWLELMLPLAMREDIGAVGCVLLYPDSTIQHAGIVLDELSIAKHLALGEAPSYLSDHGVESPIAVAAVTAACMLMRRALFLRLHGFNENNLPVAYNDVDLCLRITDKGLPIVLQPQLALTHHESISRQSDELPANRPRALKEFTFMQNRWRHRLSGERYEQGIPAAMLELSKSAAADLDTMLRLATEDLYQDKGLESGFPKSTAQFELADNAEDWRRRYHEFNIKYTEWRTRAENLARAHQLIEDSVFWRMTAPLRYVRDLISGRKLPVAGKSSSSELADAPSDTPAPEQKSELDYKHDHDQAARDDLDEFLAGASTLIFAKPAAPRVSILLVFYNQAHLSYLCLQSILATTDASIELILVDNSSADATSALLDKIENAKIIRNEKNLGFVKAVNQGAAIATGDYLLLLNNDAILQPGSLQYAIQTLESDFKIGAVGAKIRLLDGSLQEAGSIIWSDGACLGYGRGRRPDEAEFMFKRDVDYCSGAFLLMRNKLFQELAGFDEAFAPAYYEESDFCIRLQQQGYRIVYEPRAEIIHYEFASSGGISGASQLQAKHRKILCRKHADFLRNKLANQPSNILPARTSNNFPNVLVIDDRVPDSSLGAGYPRGCLILNLLADMPLNISFYPLLFPFDDWPHVYSILPREIEVLLELGTTKLRALLTERKGFYQYIMVSRVHNMEVFNEIVKTEPELIEGVEIIYDAEAVSATREVLRRQVLGEPLAEKQQLQLVQTEIEQARLARTIVAVSRKEALLFEEFGHRNTAVLGHTLETQPSPHSFDQRQGMLFVGALRDDGSPNVDSLLWFTGEVLPLIKRSIPAINLVVVGDSSAPSLADIDDDSISLVGRLESIDTVFNECRLFVAPTRFAAGIPHKVHEAASRGLPCVTTTLLSEQLGWNSGEQLLASDSAEEFAEHCIQLYQNRDLWQSIRENSLAAVTEDCAQEIFRDTLAGLFKL
jgi:O-antigen biosynthesis protein